MNEPSNQSLNEPSNLSINEPSYKSVSDHEASFTGSSFRRESSSATVRSLSRLSGEVPSARDGILDRIQRALPASARLLKAEPHRRKLRADWLMHRPLEGRGLTKPQHPLSGTAELRGSHHAHADDEESSSDSSDSGIDEVETSQHARVSTRLP